MHYAIALLPLLLASPTEDSEPAAGITLEQTLGRRGRLRLYEPPTPWRWASDGVHLVRGRGEDAVLVDPKTWEDSKPPARAEERARSESRRSSSGPRGELWRASPDGRHAAFVEDGDLIVVSTETEERWRVTDTGGPERLNGRLDWVYQEEIFGRGNWRGFWWSPDSRYVAFLSLDETRVHDFTVVDHIESDSFRVTAEVTRYPKAGDPNPTVALGIADVSTREVEWPDLGRYEDSEPLIVRVSWAPDSRWALFTVQDRIQSWADLNAYDPTTESWRTLIHESSEAWVDRPRPPHWLEDGSFLWTSDRTGYQHLYHYSAGGELVRAVTEGEWAVRSIQEIDEERGRLWFTATRDGAVDSNLYRIELDGTGLQRLTRGPGRHSVQFNGDRSLLVDTVSTLDTPPEIRLCDGEGEVLRVLGRSSIREDLQIGSWKLCSIPTRDGISLDAAYLQPPSFDPERSHPVWIETYSGPDSPSVRNGWSDSLWHQFLAQEGLIVFRVNVRTASGRGQRVTEQCHERLGVLELQDLEDAVDWLTAYAWADASRVGISGHSYGGFMTAYALTHSDRFALGIAQSGVYDWGMYDTVYTERFMGLPELNPEGYEASSVIAAAKNLHGHLLITHGVMDENVHVQNAMQLAYALQRAEQPFEMMLYPQNRHGIADSAQRRHHRRLEWRVIREHLLGEVPAAAR